MPIYNKPPLTAAGQVAHLVSKGMAVPDPAAAEQFLLWVGLYRFKGDAHHFKDTTSKRYLAVGFADVQELMRLDEELRLLVLAGIQKLEIALRVRMSEQMTLNYHPHWYADPAVMPQKRRITGRNITMRTHAELLAGRAYAEFLKSHDDSPRHYRRTYDAWVLPPSWIMTEVLSFGTWSMVFASLPPPDRQVIAQYFALPSDILENWLQALTVLRNKAAHHSRLRNDRYKPVNLPGAASSTLRMQMLRTSFAHLTPETTLAPRLYAMHHLLTSLGERQWTHKLKQAVSSFPANQLQYLGFRPGWEVQPEWK